MNCDEMRWMDAASGMAGRAKAAAVEVVVVVVVKVQCVCVRVRERDHRDAAVASFRLPSSSVVSSLSSRSYYPIKTPHHQASPASLRE